MSRAALLFFLAAVPTPALACLPPPPPPPGVPYPTETERLRRNFDFFDSIVVGEVAEPGDWNESVKVRIVHVFKGSVQPGQVFDMPRGYGFDPPPCLPMMVAPPIPAQLGDRMLIAFRDVEPVRNNVYQRHYELMLREGWIEPPPESLRVY